jgi:predicted acylesterase/phospholipase RssA
LLSFQTEIGLRIETTLTSLGLFAIAVPSYLTIGRLRAHSAIFWKRDLMANAAVKAAITHDPILVDLALQGGGSHGAFTWGVLDSVADTGIHGPAFRS